MNWKGFVCSRRLRSQQYRCALAVGALESLLSELHLSSRHGNSSVACRLAGGSTAASWQEAVSPLPVAGAAVSSAAERDLQALRLVSTVISTPCRWHVSMRVRQAMGLISQNVTANLRGGTLSDILAHWEAGWLLPDALSVFPEALEGVSEETEHMSLSGTVAIRAPSDVDELGVLHEAEDALGETESNSRSHRRPVTPVKKDKTHNTGVHLNTKITLL